MEIFKYLKDNLLIITNESFKEQILLNLKKMYRLKFMNIKEFLENLIFSYNEQAIYYLMKEYDYKYDVAKMYLENIYYVENIDDNNINRLQQIKKELEERNLLKQNKYFQDYLKEIDIIIYNYDLNKFEQKQIEKLKKITNVLVINDQIKNKEHTVYEFPTIEEEITFVATKIVELIKNNIPLSSIKLINIYEAYFNPLNRIFSFFNLDVDLNNISLYSNLEVNSFLEKLKETKNLKETLKEIKTNSDIFEIIVNICNKYAFVQEIDKYIIECIEEEIKQVTIKDAKENIKLSKLDDNFKDTDYVFLMNFNLCLDFSKKIAYNNIK